LSRARLIGSQSEPFNQNPREGEEGNVTVLKKPLVALLISPGWEQRKAILESRVQASIRTGHREGYEPGRPLMLCCQTDPWCVMAFITTSRFCQLSEVTEEEWEACGYANKEGMFGSLQRFYPDITENDDVTIIRWNNVSGKLVDDLAKLRKSSWVLQGSHRESSF